MTDTKEHTDEPCDVTVAPAKLAAGTKAAVVVSVAFTPPRDLAGRVLVLRREDGEEVLAAELGGDCDGVNATAVTPLVAPAETGAVSWLALLKAEEGEADEVLGTTRVSVEAHRTSVLVWDVPPTVTIGEPFRFKVGLKCLAGCRHEGWSVAVSDAEGTRIADARPGAEPWSGTAAMFWTEVEANAPAGEGHYRWTARLAPPEGNLPHEPAEVAFGVQAVPPAEFRLRVEAYDRKAQAPVRRAKVVMHPYRAFTDEEGVADLRVAKGEYRLFISGSKFIPFKDLVRVEGDVTIRAELDEDRGMGVEDIWA